MHLQIPKKRFDRKINKHKLWQKTKRWWRAEVWLGRVEGRAEVWEGGSLVWEGGGLITHLK